jgi:hypothetical protein
MIFSILLGVFVFFFFCPYHAHKLYFSSSPCVFPRYSSSHLGYHFLDLTSKYSYVTRHVRFHEDVFPFANFEQIAQKPFTSSQHTHLPTLNPTLNFHPTTPPIHQTINSNRPPTAPIPLHYSPTRSTTISSPPSHAPLSPSICFYNDHCAGTTSPFSELHASSSDTVEKLEFVASSPLSVVVQFGPSIDSPADLQLYIDLSSYPLQQLMGSSSFPHQPVIRQHPVVLRPRLLKIILLTTFVTTSIIPICRVLSPLTYKPIVFYDANRYKAWHGAMHEKIQALCSNDTWSLIPYHPFMNVVGNQWAYRIKRHVDGSIERYKARLIARGFTQQKGIDYSETFNPVIKQSTVRLVFFIVVSYNWKIHQLDIHNAFLNSVLNEQVYMKQPLGFVDSTLPSHVYRLHKSLYGLK